jgi:hypothetical protein
MTDDINRMLDSFPEGWRPKVGDKLIGAVIGLETRTGEYGEYPIVVVRTDEGQDFAFHAYHTVAKSELEKLQPQVGDRIGIAYHGPHPARGYERYRIIIVRRAGEAAADNAPPDPPEPPQPSEPPELDGGGDDIPF